MLERAAVSCGATGAATTGERGGSAGKAARASNSARLAGGIKDGGSAAGISLPASLPRMRYMAIANSSFVKCPSWSTSAKSLERDCQYHRIHGRG